MFDSILNGIKNLFSGSERELQDTEILQFNRTANYEQRKEYLKKHLNDVYNWIVQAEPYVDRTKLDKVANLSIQAHGDKQTLLYLEKYALNMVANKNNLDAFAIEIEKKKLTELQEMSWRQSQGKRI